MRAENVIVAVRDANLSRIGLIPSKFLNLTATVRFNNVGVWTLSLPATHPMAAALRDPGAGIIVSVPGDPVGGVKTWQTLFSGPRKDPKRSVSAKTQRAGVLTVSGTTDDIILGDPVTFPDPSNGNAETQAAATDDRTGPIETLMHEFVDVNLGPSAAASRQNPKLTMGLDLARGDTITVSKRFKNLGETVAELAAAAGLGFRVVQEGDALVFQTYMPEDRARLIRMSVFNGALEGYEITEQDPSVTHVLVAGQGEGADRIIKVVTSTALEAWSAATGRRIEAFLDKRQTTDPDALVAEGLAYLADNGVTDPVVAVKPVDSTTMELGRHWNLGDRVSVIIDDQEPSAVVTEVSLAVNASVKGVKIAAAIGQAQGYSAEARNSTRITKAEQRLNQLETSEAATATGDALATPNTLVLRDAAGRSQIVSPAVAADIANKGYVDTTVAAIPTSTFTVTSPLGHPQFTFARAAEAAPTNCLWYEGQAVSRTTYAAHFAWCNPVIGTPTVTVATPGVFTLTAHGLLTGQMVYLTTTGALPTGLAQNTAYWVIYSSANTFSLATSEANAKAGTAIATTGTQSGTHTLRTTFGVGNGSTTYNVPDMRGKVPVGYKSAGAFAFAPGVGVGEETHLLTTTETPVPDHAHDLNGRATSGASGTGDGPMRGTGGADLNFRTGTGVRVSSTYGSAAFNNAGVTPHNVVQPSIVGRWFGRYADVTLAPAGSTAAIPATAGTVALRDSGGRTQVGTPVATADAATKGYVDTAAAWAANDAWAASRVPAFHVWMNGSFNSSGSVHDILLAFDQVRVNQGGGWNTTTKKFTAPVAGLYEFELSLCNTAATVGPEGGIYKNNASFCYLSIAYVAYVPATQKVQMVLAAGDVIHAVMRNNNGQTVAVDGTRSYFSGKLLSLT